MSGRDVEAYLHAHIPLSAAMGVRVREASPERVVLAAPLEPNLNHQSTAFGGSVAALAILAGWTLIHLRLDAAGAPSRTVVQKSHVDFRAHVDGPFEAVAEAPDTAAWKRFLKTLERRGRARVRVRVGVTEEGSERAVLEAAYVSFAGVPE